MREWFEGNEDGADWEELMIRLTEDHVVLRELVRAGGVQRLTTDGKEILHRTYRGSQVMLVIGTLLGKPGLTPYEYEAYRLLLLEYCGIGLQELAAGDPDRWTLADWLELGGWVGEDDTPWAVS